MRYSEIMLDIYLDYKNNYISIAQFAEDNLLDFEHARMILAVGREIATVGLKQYQEGNL